MLTTIKIKRDTQTILKNMKIIERESYDAVIKRLIKEGLEIRKNKEDDIRLNI